MKRNEGKRGFLETSYSIVVVTVWFFITLIALPSAGALEKGGKYPSRPIRYMSPAAAGGSVGSEIRAIVPFLEKDLGVPIVIEYVTGADGGIAYSKMAQEKPNGYTILQNNLISPLTLEMTRDSGKYSVKDYTPICGWNVKYQVLIVHPETWKTFAEWLSEAKKRTMTVAGTGGHTILNVRLMEAALGIKLNLVPYKSSGEGIAAVAGKHVDSLLTYETGPKPMLLAGKLRAIAVLARKPDPLLPGVPNLKELGHEEVPIVPAYGNVMAPPKTPRAMTAVIERAIRKTVTSPEFAKIADKLGLYIDFMTAEELRKARAEQYEILNKFKQYIK